MGKREEQKREEIRESKGRDETREEKRWDHVMGWDEMSFYRRKKAKEGKKKQIKNNITKEGIGSELMEWGKERKERT